jgi:hypothetical protein
VEAQGLRHPLGDRPLAGGRGPVDGDYGSAHNPRFMK